MNKKIIETSELELHWAGLMPSAAFDSEAEAKVHFADIVTALRRVEVSTRQHAFGMRLCAALMGPDTTGVENDLLRAIEQAAAELLEIAPALERGDDETFNLYRAAAVTIFAKVREALPPYKRHVVATDEPSGVHARIDIDTSDNAAQGSEVMS